MGQGPRAGSSWLGRFKIARGPSRLGRSRRSLSVTVNLNFETQALQIEVIQPAQSNSKPEVCTQCVSILLFFNIYEVFSCIE